MNRAVQLSGELIQLSGVDFRGTRISCPACAWLGVVGELIVPNPTTRDGSVIYACPTCRQNVARHIGLNDAEVLQELEKIQKLLDVELAETSRRSELVSNEHEPLPQIATVDERVRYLHDAPAVKAGPEAESREELDFAVIRARLVQRSA